MGPSRISKCDLIWKRIFADVLKVRISNSGQAGLNPVMSVLLLLKGKEKTQRQREKKCMRRWRQKLEFCSYKPTNVKECPEPPEAGRGKATFSEGAWPCPHLRLELLASTAVRG